MLDYFDNRFNRFISRRGKSHMHIIIIISVQVLKEKPVVDLVCGR